MRKEKMTELEKEFLRSMEQKLSSIQSNNFRKMHGLPLRRNAHRLEETRK